MPEQTGRIVQELMPVPHIEGRRISVLTIHDRVEGRGLDPKTVADRHDLDVGDVYHALAYYHDNPDEMMDLREQREELVDEFREEVEENRPDHISP